MGYRSQVAGVFSVDKFLVKPETGESYWDYDKAKFREMIGFIKLSRFYELWNTTDDDRNCFGWEDGCFVLYGASFKWYSEYEDVRAWHDLWKSMQDIEGISGYFCRVGEESGDVDEETFGDDPNYDHFHHFSAISFESDHILGKRITDEEEQTEQAQTDTQSQPDCAGANHAT